MDEKTLADEMREQANMWECSGKTMYAIGAVSLLRRWADELESRYVALPTDINGRPWHIGDECELHPVNALVDRERVSEMTLMAGVWLINDHVLDICIRPKSPADRLREWVRRARADEHMDLRELDRIADAMDGGED